MNAPEDLNYAEICAGQRALARYAGDPVSALEAGDPTFTALIAAARARAAGVQVAALFHDTPNTED